MNVEPEQLEVPPRDRKPIVRSALAITVKIVLLIALSNLLRLPLDSRFEPRIEAFLDESVARWTGAYYLFLLGQFLMIAVILFPSMGTFRRLRWVQEKIFGQTGSQPPGKALYQRLELKIEALLRPGEQVVAYTPVSSQRMVSLSTCPLFSLVWGSLLIWWLISLVTALVWTALNGVQAAMLLLLPYLLLWFLGLVFVLFVVRSRWPNLLITLLSVVWVVLVFRPLLRWEDPLAARWLLGGGILAALLIIAFLAQCRDLLRQPRYHLLLVTNQRVILVSKREAEEPLSWDHPDELQATDSLVGVCMRFTEGGKSFDDVVLPSTAQTNRFLELLRGAHPTWPVPAAIAPRPGWRSEMVRKGWPALAASVLFSLLAAHLGAGLACRGLALKWYVIPPLKQWTEGNPEPLLQGCQFVLRLWPKDPAAWSTQGLALWSLERYEESEAALEKALTLTGGLGKSGKIAVDSLPKVRADQAQVSRWREAYRADLGVTEEAFREYYLACLLWEKKMAMPGRVTRWKRSREHVRKALALQPDYEPAKRLAEQMEEARRPGK